jgi:hypothetical protein
MVWEWTPHAVGNAPFPEPHGLGCKNALARIAAVRCRSRSTASPGSDAGVACSSATGLAHLLAVCALPHGLGSRDSGSVNESRRRLLCVPDVKLHKWGLETVLLAQGCLPRLPADGVAISIVRFRADIDAQLLHMMAQPWPPLQLVAVAHLDRSGACITAVPDADVQHAIDAFTFDVQSGEVQLLLHQAALDEGRRANLALAICVLGPAGRKLLSVPVPLKVAQQYDYATEGWAPVWRNVPCA